MANIYYTAILERGDDCFGVFFPDLPGCVTVGDTQDEALINAEEVLAIYLDDLTERKLQFPTPTPIGDIERDTEIEEIARALVKGVVPDKKQRINIMMDESLIAAIDKISNNRSAFISKIVRENLAGV